MKPSDIRDIKFRLTGEHANLHIPRARALLKQAQETIFPLQTSVWIEEGGVSYHLQHYHGQFIITIVKQGSETLPEDDEEQFHWFVGIPVAAQVMLNAGSPAAWTQSGFGIHGFNTDLFNKEFPQGYYGAYKYAFWRYDEGSGKIICSIKPYKEVIQSPLFSGGKYCISNAKSDPGYGERYFRKGNRIISWLFTHSWAGIETNLFFTYGFPPGFLLQKHLPTPAVFEDGHQVYTLPQDKFTKDTILIEGVPTKLGYNVAAAGLSSGGAVVTVSVIAFAEAPCFLFSFGLSSFPLSGAGLAVCVGDEVLLELDPEQSRIQGSVRLYESGNRLVSNKFPLSINGESRWTTLSISDTSASIARHELVDGRPLSWPSTYQVMFVPVVINTSTSTGTQYPAIGYLAGVTASCMTAALIADTIAYPPCGLTSYGAAFYSGDPITVPSSTFVGSNYVIDIEGTNPGFTRGDRAIFNFLTTPAFGITYILHRAKLLGKEDVDITYEFDFTHTITGHQSGSFDQYHQVNQPLAVHLYDYPVPGCFNGTHRLWYIGELPTMSSSVYDQVGFTNVDYFDGRTTTTETFKVNGDEFSSDIIFTYDKKVGGTITNQTSHSFNTINNVLGAARSDAGQCGPSVLSRSELNQKTFSGTQAQVTGEGEAFFDIIHPNLYLDSYVTRTVKIIYDHSTKAGDFRDTTTIRENNQVISVVTSHQPLFNQTISSISVTITYDLYLLGTKIQIYSSEKTYTSNDYVNIPLMLVNGAIQNDPPFSNLLSNQPVNAVFTTGFIYQKVMLGESNERDINPRFSCVFDETSQVCFISFHDDFICGTAQKLDNSTESVGALFTYNRLFKIDNDAARDVGDPMKALEEYTSEAINPNALWRLEGDLQWVYKLGVI